MSLRDTDERLIALKQEHLRDEQRAASGRDTSDEDLATLAALLAGTGVSADDAVAFGGRRMPLLMDGLRDLRDRDELSSGAIRAVLFAAWIDGLMLGLHHMKAVPS